MPQQGKRRLSLERLRGSADTVKINNAIASNLKNNATSNSATAAPSDASSTTAAALKGKIATGEAATPLTKPRSASYSKSAITKGNVPSSTKPVKPRNHINKKKALRPVPTSVEQPRQDTYWTVTTGRANRTGHTCRECKHNIIKSKYVATI